MLIPKIIHFIWINCSPTNSTNLTNSTKINKSNKNPIRISQNPINREIQSWKDMNPDYEIIVWTDKEIKKRNMIFKCQKKNK